MLDDSSRYVLLPVPRAARAGRLFRTSGLITLFSLVSRVLCFLGDTLKSHYFGAGGLVDAFNVAAAVPSLLNDLLIQGLVNSSYVPVLSRAKEELWRLANALLNLTSLFLGVAVLLMEWAAPFLAHLLNGGASAEIQALTAYLLHLTLPVLLLLNLSGVLSAL